MVTPPPAPLSSRPFSLSGICWSISAPAAGMDAATLIGFPSRLFSCFLSVLSAAGTTQVFVRQLVFCPLVLLPRSTSPLKLRDAQRRSEKLWLCWTLESGWSQACFRLSGPRWASSSANARGPTVCIQILGYSDTRILHACVCVCPTWLMTRRLHLPLPPSAPAPVCPPRLSGVVSSSDN